MSVQSKQLSGIGKLPAIIKMMSNKEVRALPLQVVLGINSVFKHGKMTKMNGKVFMNSFSPPFPSEAFDRYVRGIKYLRKGQGIPIYTDIAITKKCAYSCWHCSYKNREPGNELETEQLKNLIGNLLDMGTCIVGITGGEPLLRNDLPEILSAIDERAASFLFTTGYNLTSGLAEQLKEGGLTIPIISLDHYKKEIHDELRGFKGAFEMALDAIKIFKEKGFYVCLTMAPTKDVANARAEIERYLSFVKDLGVHEVRIAVPSLSGNLLGKTDIKFGINETTVLNELNIFYNTKTKYPTVSSFSLIESKDQFGCGAGFHFCFIDHMGNVCPCDVSPLKFGNITETDFKNIWSKMTGYFHSPRGTCYSNVVSESVKELFEGYLPLSIASSEKIVQDHPPTTTEYQLPRFYQDIGFKRE